MRSLEDITRDLTAARDALTRVEGTPAEVYSRIVGYYRSVRNWNRGKREEYDERKLYRLSFTDGSGPLPATAPVLPAAPRAAEEQAGIDRDDQRLLLFIRPACPACPGAKAAAGQLGIPVDLVNADTDEGLAEAERRQVFSTPTAILLSREGKELGRALDARTIAAFSREVEQPVLQEAVSL